MVEVFKEKQEPSVAEEERMRERTARNAIGNASHLEVSSC